MRRKKVIALLMICVTFMLSACQDSRMQEYYAQKDNYVTAEGTVAYISYDEDNMTLYFDFLDLSPTFDDTCFKIVGKNFHCVQESGIDQTIQLGDRVEFMTAPKYFGDGYVMPIVSISVNGKVLLEFEEGFSNFLEWLN